MDVFLEEKCPNLLELIKDSGYAPEDVERDPFYCVLGLCSDEYFHKFVKENQDEIEAAIQFASEWDIDPKEWDLSAEIKKNFKHVWEGKTYCDYAPEIRKNWVAAW